jgi:GNAT superfamily N-acetyltransferase
VPKPQVVFHFYRHAAPQLIIIIIIDVPLILELIRELATYEKEPPSTVQATESSLSDTLGFTPNSKAYAYAILAFTPSGEPAGMALYFTNYSTWRAKPGIYLEDLYVKEKFRGRGYGTALLAALAQGVKEINGARLEWSVLKCDTRRREKKKQKKKNMSLTGIIGNEPSIRFYESIGAENIGNEWQIMRITDSRLDKLAQKGPEVAWE